MYTELCITDTFMDSSLDQSFEEFSPCLESTPNVQRSKRNPEKGSLFVCLLEFVLKKNASTVKNINFDLSKS